MARRTRQTWELAAAALGASPGVTYDERVYAAGVPGLLEVVRETPAGVGTLLMVGHNPGMQALASTVAGGGARDLLEQVRAKFPTSALAVLAFTGGWDDVTEGTARLVDFAAPRG